MIEKEITFDYETEDIPMHLLDTQFFNKTASYGPDIQKALDELERKVDHIYVLVNALSAGEYFGPNRNGDYFPEDELIKHHKTYETLGFQYRHHANKDPKKSFGKVIYSHYNPEMKRVEIIVELPVNKNKDIVERLNRGEYPATSMGCRVPYDVCSICGNKAKTRAQYCDHLKVFMGRTLNDGRRVYAINVNPKFFDNSWVTRPAEATAGVLAKVASIQSEEQDKIADNKEAVIKKEIPAEIVDLKDDPKNLILCSQKRIPKDILNKIAEFEDAEILTTLETLRVMPTADEFEQLGITNVFERTGEVNIKIAEELANLLPNLVLTKPRILSRLTKTADVTNESVSDLYKRFISDFNTSKASAVKLASKNPWLVNLWVGDLGELDVQNTILKMGSDLNNIMIEVPESYIADGLQQFNGTTPFINKNASAFSTENLFKYLDLGSLDVMYNSIMNWEE